MKTLTFELSKRLNDLGLLDNMETTNFIFKNPVGDIEISNHYIQNYGGYNNIKECFKALTLEDAIEFLNNNSNTFEIIMGLRDGYLIKFDNNKNKSGTIFINGKTLLEAIEKMIEYLLDNNLLTSLK